MMKMTPQFWTLTAIIAAAALSRLLPHFWNATPIAAMALFGGVYFRNRALALLIPLTAMAISDVFLGWHEGLPAVYLSFVLTALLGMAIRPQDGKNPSPIVVAAAILNSSLLFFLVTNFVWLYSSDGLFPRTWEGLQAAYISALPFLRGTMLGDAFYAILLFGGYAVLQRQFPLIRNDLRSSATQAARLTGASPRERSSY